MRIRRLIVADVTSNEHNAVGQATEELEVVRVGCPSVSKLLIRVEERVGGGENVPLAADEGPRTHAHDGVRVPVKQEQLEHTVLGGRAGVGHRGLVEAEI